MIVLLLDGNQRGALRVRWDRPRFGGIAAAVAMVAALPAAGQEMADAPFTLGVQTHFSQGWRAEYLDLLPELGVRALRDEIVWREVETVPGEYSFADSRLHFLSAAAERGLDPLIVFTDTNPLHDGGNTPWSRQGQQALADYIVAVLDTYGGTIRQIEIGNEFNSDDFVSGPFAEDKPVSFTALLETVHETVKARHPETQILCTGTHSVAIGFFRALFENGALDYCDAISLHPYRDRPEHLGVEIARLNDLMAEFGRVLPIHATEFGKWFDDPAEAPDYMVKMVALMGEAGIAGAWWYALLDQPWYPNMGLYHPDGPALPAADSFRLLQEELLPLGRPRKVGDSPLDLVFDFGGQGRAVVAWGAPGRIEVTGAARFLDTRGSEIAQPTTLGDAPVVILGENVAVTVTREREMVDVAYGFGMEGWSYHSRRADGREEPLVYLDGNWTSVLGDPWLRPLLVSPDWISGARFDDGPHVAIERFTASVDGPHEISGVWTRPGDEGPDGADITVSVNGAVVATGVTNGEAEAGAWRFGPQTIELSAGDRVDFAVGPNLDGGDDAVQRQITILMPEAGDG